MAVEDELRLDFQGEDSSLSSTAAKVVDQINSLDNSINKLINSFNAFSDVSSSAERGLSSFVQSTGNLEDIGNKVQKMTESFSSMSPAVESVSNNMKEFSDSFDSIKDIKNAIDEAEKETQKYNSAVDEMASKSNKLVSIGQMLATAFKVVAATVGVVYGALKKWTLEAANATRAQIRFGAVFDKNNGELAEAKRWVDAYSSALYLDNVEVENAISKFRVLTNSMGMNNEKSKEMSFNMTQLAYDMSAVSGNDVSQTVNQLTSALNGQTKALAEYGIAIDSNTMQQYLNAHGIDRKVSSLTAAQRAEVRYMQIMERSSGMQGYYAKTLMSPANAANIVKTQFRLLTREIGNVFIPILMALVPVVITVTRALRSLAQALAKLFGVNIDFSDYSDGLSLMSGGIDGIGDSADGTSEKVKNMLRDFDDLHVVDFGDDVGGGTSGGAGGGAGGGASLFDPYEYNGGWENLTNALDTIPWDEIQKKAYDIGVKLATFLNDGIASTNWYSLGNTVAQGLNTVLYFAYGFLSTFNFEQFGTAIANFLNGALGNIDWGLLAKTLSAGIIGALNTLTGFITTFDWGIILDAIIEFFMNVDYGGVAKAFQKFFGAAFGTIVKLQFTIAQKIGELISGAVDTAKAYFQQKIEECGGNVVLGILKGIVDGLIGIGQWIIDNIFTPFIDGFKQAFGISSPSTVMEEMGRYIIEGLLNGIKSLVEKVTEIWNNMKNTAITIFNNIKDKLSIIMSNIKTMATTQWENIKKTTLEKINNVKTNVSDKFNDIKNTIKTKIESARDIVKNAIDKIKSFFNFDWKLPDIKIPHFGIDWDASGVVGQAFQKLGFPGLPKLRVDWYAEGGFPDKGDLFIANEREPELIGSMGNRSVVANNRQITEGIAEATYGAFRQAFSEMGDSFGGDTLVYVGDTQITDIITKKKRIQDKRFGR